MTASGTWKAGLVACAILAASVAGAADGRPEKLLGLRVDDDKGQVAFDVWTTGCTEKRDFRVERSAEGFTLVRVERDTCKMMPDTTQVTFTFAELGLKPHAAFTVGNRFAVGPVSAAID
jgi:hypothetical protein